MKKRLFILNVFVLLATLTSCNLVVGSSSSSSSSEAITSEISSESSSISTSSSVSESSSSISSNAVSSNSSHSSLTATSSASNSISSEENSNNPTSGDVNLSIVELNDIHGYAYESSYNADFNLASCAYYIDQLRNQQEYDNCVLIANGDTFQGTAFSNLSHGKSVINAMNEMNFDMMGIGNHEFDWGLDEVLNYWDLDPSNGEANFPLINGNVRDSNDNNNLVGEKNTNDNILPYRIVNKGGINVGLLSYIGDQTSSICQNKFGSYYIDCYGYDDNQFVNHVRNQAIACKNDGADIIVVNFHEGNRDGIDQLQYNQDFAQLKDDNGNYLIDAVINGHTHTLQKGTISRDGAQPLPVVQASCNSNAVGVINLKLDASTKKVTNVDVASNRINYLVNKNNKNQNVQAVLEEEYQTIYPQISEVLDTAGCYATKDSIGAWTANIMKKYADADVALINAGGIRSTASLTNGSQITMEQLYEINPFDNNLCYVLVKGSELKRFYNSYSGSYYFNSDFTSIGINDNAQYKLITIDYVYYGYFAKSFPTKEEIKIAEQLCARDLMVLDLKARNNTPINFDLNDTYLETAGWPSKQ